MLFRSVSMCVVVAVFAGVAVHTCGRVCGSECVCVWP